MIGRLPEISELTRVFVNTAAQFVAVYGRRRVGKTYLVRNFFQPKARFMEVTGKLHGEPDQQLSAFYDGLLEAFEIKVSLPQFKNWREAFKSFTSLLEREKQPFVLFLDELPWLSGKSDELLVELDYFWNRYWSQIEHFKLVVCGSATHWILDKIVNDTGGLYNRLTSLLHLKPFTLGETAQYLAEKGVRYLHQDVLDLYLCIGGVPYYLDHIRQGESVAQSIQHLCFDRNAQLKNEFTLLIDSLFRKSDQYKLILNVLCDKRYGVSQDEIARELEISSGGTLSRRLEELEACGFVRRYLPYGKKSRGTYYRVIDEYMLFYRKWIAPTLGALATESDYWLKRFTSPQFSSWAGYNFETICHKHTDQILKELGISGISVNISHWLSTVPEELGFERTKCQIDLVLDRSDNIITLCEVKYSKQPYIITEKLVRELRLKESIFQNVTKTRKGLNSVLLLSGDLGGKNLHSGITKVLEGNCLFQS